MRRPQRDRCSGSRASFDPTDDGGSACSAHTTQPITSRRPRHRGATPRSSPRPQIRGLAAPGSARRRAGGQAGSRDAERTRRTPAMAKVEQRERLESVDPSGLEVRPARSAADFAADHWAELSRLDLLGNIAELEANGLTVIPPAKVASDDFISRRAMPSCGSPRMRTGEHVDVEGATDPGVRRRVRTADVLPAVRGRRLPSRGAEPDGAGDGDVPARRELRPSNCLAGLKGPGRRRPADALRQRDDPGPVPAVRPGVQRDVGADRLRAGIGRAAVRPRQPPLRPPPAHRARPATRSVPVHAEAGSIVFWHGNTWHAARRPAPIPGCGSTSSWR